ncbi:MAG: PAS domain S-box protein [Anaerolineae bacterium]|nr:PAS domain S-box protein [Anaerolineae bacterium]
MALLHQNVTDMNDTQEELEASKRLLEAILDNLVDGILTFDSDGEIQSLNRAASYIFGYSAEAIIGRNVRELIPSLPNQSDHAEFDAFLKHFNGLGDELDGQRRDGSIFPMYFSISEVSHDQQKLYIAVVQDFTERKFMETQVREKETLNLELEKERELRDVKNRFISMMSHDLKTPLAAIRLANSMLRNYGDRSSEQEKQESYDAIDQQVEHLSELINDVMTISRQDFTGAELDRQIIDLETYCRDIIEELQLAYRMTRTIRFKGTRRRIEVFIDIKLMRRALTNLLTNAIKYSPESKPVTMELSYANCEAIIKVRDQGIGIPETDLPRLFEPFNRASNVGSIQGTGLGLAIAKQAVDLHGGKISVESVVGKGTTFTIMLPAEGC